MAEIKTLMDIAVAGEVNNYLDKSDIIKNKQPHTFAKFFPKLDTSRLVVKWMSEKIKIDKLLSPATFDSDIPLRNREGISEKEVRMPFFREGQMFGEHDMEEFNEVLQMNLNNSFVREFVNKTFRSFAGLINGAIDIPEVMRANIITTGAFTIKQANEYGGNVTHKFNYDASGDWAGTHIIPLTSATDAWSDTENSRPDNDIKYIGELFRAKGMRIKEMIVGGTTLTYLEKNKNLKSLITNPLIPIVTVNEKTLIELFTSILGYPIKLTVNQEMYKSTNDVDTFYYPQDNCATFIGEDILGYTYFGKTPAELAKQADKNIDIIRRAEGMVVGTEWKKAPIQKLMYVEMLTLPTFEKMEAVYNLTWNTAPTLYTVTYSGNGNTSGTAPAAQTQTSAGASITVAAGTGLAKDTESFSKWNTKADGSGTDYAAGASITPTENTVLYAIYA